MGFDSIVPESRPVEKNSSDEDGRATVSEVTEEKSCISVFDDRPLPISSVEIGTIEESDTMAAVVVV
jgi:hypothetical protein